MTSDGPSEGSTYNLRYLEIACCNMNGMTVRTWYKMDVEERTLKVAAMMLPNIFSEMGARQIRQSR